MNWKEHLDATKIELDKTSPSFCLAKWLQVTLHLQIGFNHSCHHPRLHKIPLDEIKKDPSALHNTKFKKKLRKMMLAGERPEECGYCWGVEDSGDHHSDRIIKSGDHWALPQIKKIPKRAATENINPTYVEVSFGSECNFRCTYCIPYVSSSVFARYKKFGPFSDLEGLDYFEKKGYRAYKPGEPNPYVDAFWKWFPDLVKTLKVFRITGGEPLMNFNTFKVLDFLDQNPAPELELCINSNLGVHDRQFDLFVAKTKKIVNEKKIKKFTLYTSIDTYGKQAEFIRTGLDYNKFMANVRKYLEQMPTDLSFMVTFNILSVPQFKRLLKDILKINKEFQKPESPNSDKKTKRTLLDISHLTHPQFYAACYLSKEWRKKVSDLVKFMEKNSIATAGIHGFAEYEILKLKRIEDWITANDIDSVESRHFRSQFYIFTQQYKEREGYNFLKYFPEMKRFITLCKKEDASIQAMNKHNSKFGMVPNILPEFVPANTKDKKTRKNDIDEENFVSKNRNSFRNWFLSGKPLFVPVHKKKI